MKFRAFVPRRLLGAFWFLLWAQPSPAQDRVPVINPVAVLLSSDTSIYAAGLSGLRSSVNAQLRVEYLDRLREQDGGAAAYFQAIESEGYPLLISFGPAASRAALQALRRTPVLLSMVDAPRSLGEDVAGSCGVGLDIRMSEFFRVLKASRPDAQRVFAFYSTPEGRFRADEGRYTDLEHGLYYESLRVRDADELARALEEIRDQADAIMVVNDPLYNRRSFAAVSAFSRKNGIVLMANFASLVRSGATFAVTPDYGNVGVVTGRMAERLLRGESTCAAEGFAFPEYTAIHLNEDYAGAQGIEFPDYIRRRARTTRLIAAGVRLYDRGEFESARRIFDAILEQDPGNRHASTYRSLAVERISGPRTRALLKSARKHMINKSYAAALNDYEHALRISPGLVEARRGSVDARRALSESESAAAGRLAKNGRIFEAVEKYQRAVRVLPENRSAHAALADLRRSHAGRVEPLVRAGIDDYEERSYDAAILKFERALLLQPTHGRAREYLRLSRKKKAALERLLRAR